MNLDPQQVARGQADAKARQLKGLAIIPARSGSKGLPDKNILPLAGKPLLAWSIDVAFDTGLYDTVHVSTDDEHYAEIAREYGAEVPWLRPEALADDQSSSWDVARWTMEQYEKRGRHFDFMTLLQPTSPFRTTHDVEASFELMRQHHYPGVISVCEMEHSPLWSNPLPEDRSLDGFIKSYDQKARQTLPTYYRLNGAIYHISRDLLFDPKRNVYDASYAYIMPLRRSIDIDTFEDFKLAEFYLKEGLC